MHGNSNIKFVVKNFFAACGLVFKNPSRPFADVIKPVKVKVKIALEQTTKAQRWSRGLALLFLQPQR